MLKPGFAIVISGPSGVGKGTIIKTLLKKDVNIHLSRSATTRAPRPNEVHAQDYYFLSEDEFDQHIQNDEFLEWCHVHQDKYGTLRSEVLNQTQNGEHIILEIDVQGFEKVKSQLNRLISIFIVPPNFETLFKRLHTRNTEDDSVIKSRLHVAGKELAAIGKYDYIVINEAVDQAVSDIKGIIDSLDFIIE